MFMIRIRLTNVWRTQLCITVVLSLSLHFGFLIFSKFCCLCVRASLISTFEVYGKDRQTNKNNKTKQKQNTKQNKTKQNKNPFAVLEIDLLNRNEYSLFTN